MSEDEEFIAYLLLICFDRGMDLRDRIEESLPLLQEALKEIGEVQPAMSSYDGSAVSYLISTSADIQPERILERLKSPKARRASPLKTHDKVLVISIGPGVAQRLERVTEWLSEYGLLA